MTHLLVRADSRRIPLADESVHCCVTSSPFWGLRDYGTGEWTGGDPECSHAPVSGIQGTSGDRANRTFTGAKPQGQTCLRCGATRIDRQIGLEPSPDDFVAEIVEVFRDVRRVLRSDGVCFYNIGDSYATGAGKVGECPGGGEQGKRWRGEGSKHDLVRFRGVQGDSPKHSRGAVGPLVQPNRMPIDGLKPKDLVGIPWRTAMALQADGWYLRDAIIWSKAEVDEWDELEGSCMPGSQRDRCTFAYEFVFMLTKSRQYYFDQEGSKTTSGSIPRNVWRINPEPTKFNHFATFPRELARRCILLGTSAKGCCPECGKPWVREVESERVATRPGLNTKIQSAKNQLRIETNMNSDKPTLDSFVGNRDPRRHVTTKTTKGWRPACNHNHEPVPCTVLDCFSGMSTTGVAADALGRNYVGLDLSREYLLDAKRRLERPHAPIRRPARKNESFPLFPDEPEGDAA